MVDFESLSTQLLKEAVQGEVLKGSPDGLSVSQIGEPAEVGSNAITFFIHESYAKDIESTKASVVVLQKKFAETVKLPDSVKLALVCDDAYLALARASEVIAKKNPHFEWAFLKATSHAIDPSAKIDSTVQISAGVCIGANAVVKARTILLPNVVIGPGAQVGEDCVLFPGCVLYPFVKVGNRVRLHSNVVLGADGFGYARGPRGSVKIYHLGNVVVHDDVEMGPGTTVDKGTLKNSVIESGVKIDNQVQVGHNGYIKSHAILCAQVGLAGNTTIGEGAILAGKAGTADKTTVGKGSVVGPMSGISKDVPDGEVVMGAFPAKNKREWWRLLATLDRLPDLFEKVKKFEKMFSQEKK